MRSQIKPFRAVLLIFLTLYSFLLTSCSGYKAACLTSLEYTPKISVKGIELTAKAFSGRDSKRYLGHNLIAKGYQPIQLHISNQSEKAYRFSPDGLSLPTASAEEVARCVKQSVVLKVLGGIVTQALSIMTTAIKAVTFFTMIVAIALPLAFFTLNGKNARQTFVIVTSGVIIAPGILNGIKTAKTNMQISKDYAYKEASEHTIEPGEIFDALIFVPKDDVENVLTVKLLDQSTEKLLVLKSQVY